MRPCLKAVLGIFMLAACCAAIAGLFLGVRHHADAGSINIDPAALVALWPPSACFAALPDLKQHG